MIPDKTQELDLRELLARYEREYVTEAERESATEAEREFFGQDWSKLVTNCTDGERDADGDTNSYLVSAPSVGKWGRAKSLWRSWMRRNWIRRMRATSAQPGAPLPRWIPVSTLIGVVLSGLGFLMLDGQGEAKTSLTSPRQGPTSAATTLAAVQRALPSASPTLSTSHDVTTGGDAPATDNAETSTPDEAKWGTRRSPQITTPTNVESLARQAVDAVLAGDHARALRLYRELSRRAPESEVYREATRILSRAPALSSKTPVERQASSSPGAIESR